MATKEQIKDSAYHCFAHYGYEATTMQDIASAVGLKKQSLYSHFGSKEELYLAVIKEQYRQIAMELYNAYGHLKEKPVEELLKGLFMKCAEIFSDRRRLLLWKRAAVYLGSGDTKHLSSDIWPVEGSFVDELHKTIRGPHPTLEDPTVFQTFIASYQVMIQGYLEWMLVKGHDDEIWKAVWMSFWQGAISYLYAN